MNDPSGLTEEEIKRVCIDVAINSDNPAIMNALEHLFILVRMTEAEYFEDCLISANMIGSQIFEWMGRSRIHEIVDEVLDSKDTRGLIALENLIDVAPKHKKN